MSVRLSTPSLTQRTGPHSALTRTFGVMDYAQGKMEERQKKSQMVQFKDQLKKMLEGPPYTLNTWNAELDEQMSSWKLMIPGAKSQPEVQKMNVYRDIMAKMSEEEKVNPGALMRDQAAMDRVAAAAGHPPGEVRGLIQRFQSLQVYQDWMKKRKAEGKRLPKNPDDMQELVKKDMEQVQLKKQRSRQRRF